MISIGKVWKKERETELFRMMAVVLGIVQVGKK